MNVLYVLFYYINIEIKSLSLPSNTGFKSWIDSKSNSVVSYIPCVVGLNSVLVILGLLLIELLLILRLIDTI